ncbi:MAG: Gfo/Idh/MocA family oxidoreductase [Chloroflexi bacterium]|nr:Gfo/Idh/MocA family oxidoreductase [Chloroflexota bacterium]
MDMLNLAIVGCGGMGTRHMYGVKEYAALVASGPQGMPAFRLAAVCDTNERNAGILADLAASELGRRPRTFTALDAMLESMPDLDAVDITTETRPHHALVCAALAGGKHVLVEKPMALTVAGCNRMMAAAQHVGRVLAVAENYRRDPLYRLLRALLDAGAIGEPWMLVDASIGGAGRIVITPWRHEKALGCALLDIGVHNVDLMLYEFGPVEQVFAQVALFDRIRRRSHAPTNTSAFYAATTLGMPEQIEADVEDTAFATLRFRNGALGQWTVSHSGHGQGFGKKALYGSRGSLEPGGARSGRGHRLYLDGRREALTDAELLALVPDFALDEWTARLFGGARLTRYELDYPAIDRKITATVLLDFARAITSGQPPEVGGAEARHAIAVVNALFESTRLNRPVAIADIEANRPEVSGWQRELDEDLGLT